MRVPQIGWPRESVLACLVFFLLGGLFVWRPLVAGPGHVFLPNDILFRYDYAYLQAQAPRPQNQLLSDVTYYYYPYVHYATQEMARGRLPLWNPLILGGARLHAAAQAALFDPVNLLTRPFGEDYYWVLGAWLRVTLAGLGVYGLLRALGRGSLAGIAGGVVFMYSGFMAAWLNYSVVTTLIWFPYLLWATLRLAQTGRLAWLGLLAFCMAAQFYGGHPETSFVIGLSWAAYTLYLLIGTARARGLPGAGRLLLRFSVAATLGIAAGLAQLLPLFDLLAHSQLAVDRHVQAGLGQVGSAGAWLRSAALAVVTLVPNFSGTPTEANYWYSSTNFTEQVSYGGLLALALALYGLAQWCHPQRIFFGLAGLLSWALIVRLPGIDLIYALPGFSLGYGARGAVLFSLCLAILAGCGLELLLQAPHTWRRTALTWAVFFTLVLSGVLLTYLAIRLGGWQPAWAQALSHGALVRLFSITHGTLYWPFVFGFLATALLASLAKWPTLTRPSLSAGAGVLFVGLLAADLLTFGTPYNPVIPRGQNLPPTPLTTWLQNHLGHDRLAGSGRILAPNLGMVSGLRDLRGYEDLATQDYAGTFGHVLGSYLGSDRDIGKLSAADKTRLDMAAVRYVLSIRDISVAHRTGLFVKRAAFGRVNIYENPGAVPRAYGVYQAEFLPGHAAIIARLNRSPFDPHQDVLLEGPAPAQPSPPQAPVTPPAVRFVADDAAHVALDASFPAPGYLVLADAWAEGWEARVDGALVPIQRADGLFRAVALGPGRHQVTFDYRPALFYDSATVSLIALLCIGALGGIDLLHNHQRLPPPANDSA